MKNERYPVIIDDDYTIYEFISNVRKGNIAKLIIYSKTLLENFFNLGLGDKKGKKEKKGSIIIGVDPSLDKYHHMGLFQDKIDKANHVLKTVGLPKQLFKNN